MISDLPILKNIKNEESRQRFGIELIASENYVSKDVLEALGSILTNKYSEGYPKKRYYGGNEYIDEIELLAIERAKELFHVDHVNVQPYSGSPANLAVHLAFLQPGDRTMGMDLAAGGHLTHGFKVSISGKYFDSVSYGVDQDGYIDYEKVMELAKEHKPKLIWCGASAYPRIIDFKKFREIADEVGAVLVADVAHIAGLIVAGEHPSPVPYVDVVTTTTHKTLRGPRGAMIMCKEEYGEQIDKAVFPGLQGGPHNHVTAGIAIALKEASTEEFKKYAKQVVLNSKKLAEVLMDKGYSLVSNGTDNHLMLVDVTKIDPEFAGGQASDVLGKIGITVNKNAIPFDPRKPWDPSGIRIGTAAITSRGLAEREMVQIADFIDKAFQNRTNDRVLKKLHEEVRTFIGDFRLPGIDV